MENNAKQEILDLFLGKKRKKVLVEKSLYLNWIRDRGSADYQKNLILAGADYILRTPSPLLRLGDFGSLLLETFLDAMCTAAADMPQDGTEFAERFISTIKSCHDELHEFRCYLKVQASCPALQIPCCAEMKTLRPPHADDFIELIFNSEYINLGILDVLRKQINSFGDKLRAEKSAFFSNGLSKMYNRCQDEECRKVISALMQESLNRTTVNDFQTIRNIIDME